MKISKRTIRQINNTRDICDYDMKNMVCTITLNFDTPEEMLDPHISTPNAPCISREFSNYLCETISEVPKEFYVDFSLKIKDYQNYDHDKLLKALFVNIDNTFFYYDENRKKDNVLSVTFIIIGILTLAINIIGQNLGWFGPKEATSTQIIESLFDIFSWVFVWEGGAILFLTYENESTSFRKEIARLNEITFNDVNNNILAKINVDYFYEIGLRLGRKERFARNFILFSNALILSLLCITLLEFIGNISFLNTTSILLYSLFFTLGFVLTFSNIQFYSEKGFLRKVALPVGVILLSLSLSENIIYLTLYGMPSIKTFILSIAFLITLIINLLCLIFMKKQSVTIK